MKKITIALCCLFSTTFAQNNIATSYCDHGDLNASRYEPSELDFHNKTVQLGFNYYLWTGNTAINYADVQEIYKHKKVLDSKVDEMIGRMKETNIFGVGQDFQVFGLGIQFRSKKDANKKLDFSFQVVDKFGMNLMYSKNLFSLLWKGNKQFAGQHVELGPLAINANYSREFVVGSAFNLFGNEENGGMRMGLRAKYIQGIGSIYMPKSNISLYTEAEGRYLELSTDYQAHTSGLKDYSAFAMNGTGMGLDLGLTGYLNKHWEFSGSILDLGQISYNKNIRNFANNGNIRYEGLVINDFFGGNSTPQYADSSAVNLFTPQESNLAYKMGLGTKIVIQAEFKTWRELKRKSEKAEARLKEKEVVSNGFFLTYVQGLNNMPGATTRPFFSFGYHRNLWDIFDIGVSAAYGGYNNMMLGAFFDLNIAHTFKIGVGSDNLTGFIMPKNSTGIDASINLSLAF